MEQKIDRLWWVLRIALGVGPFLAGLDKFFNLLTDWTQYLSPVATSILPVSPQTFMYAVGVIEMIVGIAMFTRFTREAAYVAAVWLVAIAGNLLTMGMFFDVAVRDIEIALAAFALAQLSEIRAVAEDPEHSRLTFAASRHA
jgi:uncharacterized membrane protein YphA (DoxX/SURF4 family)